jgi:hypothetical protein
MIKRSFTSDSYDQAFSEQAIKTPSFSPELLKKMNGEQVRILFSKHKALVLSFINLMGMLAFLVFMMIHLQKLHRQIDEGQGKVSKLEASIKAIQESLKRDAESLSPVHESKFGSQSQAQDESDLLINDWNIQYLGLVQAGHSFKALLEVDEVAGFFSKGQMVEGRWLIKSFDHSQMILESIKGQQKTIPLEK